MAMPEDAKKILSVVRKTKTSTSNPAVSNSDQMVAQRSGINISELALGERERRSKILTDIITCRRESEPARNFTARPDRSDGSMHGKGKNYPQGKVSTAWKKSAAGCIPAASVSHS
jgi:hypothetical protein